MHAKERLYLTAGKDRLVGEGDRRAAFLYAAVGDEIPASAVERFGLVDGRLKGSVKAEPKALNKTLVDVKGIGEATAKKLAAAGIDTVGKLAAVDPANPPTVDGLERPAWADWVADARRLAPGAAETKGG